jgi:hypothetical protein
MSALAQFQEAFAKALVSGEGSTGQFAAVAGEPGFAVYRNTVLKGSIDALQANYPSVCRLVGEEWFRGAASVYARARLPSVPMLLEYGADFDVFLQGFEPARDLPYLPAVAKLDRFWTEAHIAPDATPLDPAHIARLSADALARGRLTPHASARWCFFEGMPVATLWRRNREDAATDLHDIEWHGEGVLVVRPRTAVEVVDLDAAGCAFLDACAGGETLSYAAACALERDGTADLSKLMERLLRAGTFARLDCE